MKTLREPARSVVARLHTAARSDVWKLARIYPIAVSRMLRGRSFSEAVSVEMTKDIYIPVDAEQGDLLYLLARAVRAKTIVEFGTSFGISTIYLASALQANGGGRVIGSEMEPGKHAAALRNLAEAGVAELCDVRLGDALETFQELPEPVDMVLLDGWKDLYVPVLERIVPRLRPGAVVLADNIHRFKRTLRPYVEYVQNGENGFESQTLEISDGFEFSVYRGREARSEV